MTDSTLAYFKGSPFARMARVLVHEWSLPVTPVEWTFPPAPELFEHNPLGQVPVLTIDGHALFPTFLVLERLWEMAGRPAAAYDPERDRQRLLVTLAMLDALVAAYYQGWTGLQRVGTDYIGYDPGERNLARVERVMAWLEADWPPPSEDGGVTLPAVATACFALWADARHPLGRPLDWRRHPRLAAEVERLAQRPSFKDTLPREFRPY